MYYCDDCKRFVEGSTWECESPNHRMREVDGFSGTAFYKEMRCEVCGSTDLEEAYSCEVCGEPTLDTYCDWCMDEATSVVRHFANRTTGNEQMDRIDLLQEACTTVWVELQQEKEAEKKKSRVNHI